MVMDRKENMTDGGTPFGQRDVLSNTSKATSFKFYCPFQVLILVITPNFGHYCGLYYKHVTIVIYDRNDSVQYHKTTITIVIDDP